METFFSEVRFKSKLDGFEDRYLIEYPSSGPRDLLVIYLHSGISRAEQAFCSEYEWCFRNLRDEVMHRAGLYLSPDYRGDSWMNAAAEFDLAELIGEFKSRFGLSRCVIAGGSMGGAATLIFASRHPELVDGVIAMCPATDMRELYDDLMSREELLYRHVAKSMVVAFGGTPAQVPGEYDDRSPIDHAARLTMPVVIRHGTADPTIPVGQARALFRKLMAQGTPVRLDEIPGGDHDSPTVHAPWREYLDFVIA